MELCVSHRCRWRGRSAERALHMVELLVVALVPAVAARAADFYVAVDGNDGWSGTAPAPNADGTDGPFATLERARDAARRCPRDNERPEPITVFIRGGTYYRDHVFELGREDSGTPAVPVMFRAFKNEEVRLVGGQAIHGFEPVRDAAVLSRLDPAVRDYVRVADLRAQGVTDYGALAPRGFGAKSKPAGLELFFDDKPMTLARWPNEGFARVADVVGGEPTTSHGIKGDKIGKLVYDGDRPTRWAADDDIWLHGYWFWDWADAYEKVESIDTARHVIAMTKPYHGYGYRQGARFYALNLLAELDAPGEWYLDRSAGRLYFLPPEPIADRRVVVSVIESLIDVNDASCVTFRGLTLEACRGTAITVHGGSDVGVVGCTIRNIGNAAVIVDGGADHMIIGCDVYGAGEGAIAVSGGDRPTLTPGDHVVENNHIHDYSRWVKTYTSAIHVSGVGHHVSHNLIHDAPHNAIGLSGNEHVIEYNEIHHVCMETDDAGAFYMGRDWTQRGNAVRYNYFHDIGAHRGLIGVQAIYLDDWSSGTTVLGNVCVRAGRAVLVGGGRDNTIKDNVFIGCTPAVHVDSRGLGWAKYYFDGTTKTLEERLAAMPYREPPWSERYPQLLTLYDDEPALAKGNAVVNNICIGGRWLDLHDGLTTKVVRVEGNLVCGADAGRGAAVPEAPDGDASKRPAYSCGNIPMNEMGLYRDSRRASRLEP